ncbi:hypothetical protein SELMODRAFT_423718 [Selaginella moellendorffii]|uniref:Uncharacterized protein n=1 Tax=Selaginella moellendorffii TaxID=88036 RepID=D8SMN2_SELML|nr:hypothetical protein SELMODRAFT_423718 [Selaginella moellendorffii]
MEGNALNVSKALAFEGLGDLRGALKDLQVAIKVLPDDAKLLEKLKVIKRKLRVAFVKEVSKEEAENQKKLKKLEEASKSPQQLHLLHRSRLEFKKGHPFEPSGEDHNKGCHSA